MRLVVEVDDAAVIKTGGTPLTQPRAVATRSGASRGRSPFRATLSKRGSGRASGSADETAAAARLQTASVGSGPRPDRRISAAQPVSPTSGRVLLAARPETSEARVRIEGGALSGVELQLRAHGPGFVTA